MVPHLITPWIDKECRLAYKTSCKLNINLQEIKMGKICTLNYAHSNTKIKINYYMASSASRQDEANPVF